MNISADNCQISLNICTPASWTTAFGSITRLPSTDHLVLDS